MIGNFRLPILSGTTGSTGGSSSNDFSYVRPIDWLTLPSVTAGQQKFVGLHAIYNHDSNFCALNCASNYTVDWGDGVVENFAANVTAYHLFSYANHSGTESALGYRQSIVTITPQATFNLTSLDLNVKHNQSGLGIYSSGWLDIKMAGSLISNLIIGNDTLYVYPRNLQQFDFTGTNVITSMYHKFYGCYSLRNVVNLYTGSATNVVNMFSACFSLQTIPLIDTSAVTNMSYMFASCFLLQSIPLLSTTSANNMTGMFTGCYSLQTIPLLATSMVTNMSSMFSGCSSLVSIPLLNTEKVTNMSYMFQECKSLGTIPLLNTEKVNTMVSMFNACSSLQTIPLLNTVLVTTMLNMFYQCFSFRSIPLINTSAVTTMQNMFSSCIPLKTIPLLNTASVTLMSGMFSGCSSLDSVPPLNTTAVTDMTNMFSSCNSLQAIPALNANLVTASGKLNTIFQSNNTASKIAMTNIKITFSIASMRLSSTAIIEVFNNLATTTGQTITITGNWGVSALTAADRLIATNKGWTIVG